MRDTLISRGTRWGTPHHVNYSAFNRIMMNLFFALFREALLLVAILTLSSCATTKELHDPAGPTSVIPAEVLQREDLFKGNVKKIGFCDIAELQGELNGQMVEVEGLASYSYHYGNMLRHENCPRRALSLQHRPELAEDRLLKALKKRTFEESFDLEDERGVPVRVQGRLFFFQNSFPTWILVLSEVLEVEGIESGKETGE